ncbi:hypothetical protein GCM10011391_32370 [Pullulanibacillus camelliae]|uniref:Spore coat protein n=1 Tax=Pullulanibacillus camelliae TaxID=1707096 RepID=A0A8J3DZC5_9BACL|nr:YppG family protein [Pullulanibacillus camelliae]GGE51108.1 hypothetical protein GCM10011391_32370 [Pullulanibacillus camelliae]
MVQLNNNNQQQPPFHPMWGPPPPGPFFMTPPNNMPQSASNQSTQNNMPQFMQGFLDKDGKWDFDKMMSGADKVFKIINQTQPMIKQLGPLFNLFKK